jgi:hypothetical protein
MVGNREKGGNEKEDCERDSGERGKAGSSGEKLGLEGYPSLPPSSFSFDKSHDR